MSAREPPTNTTVFNLDDFTAQDQPPSVSYCNKKAKTNANQIDAVSANTDILATKLNINTSTYTANSVPSALQVGYILNGSFAQQPATNSGLVNQGSLPLLATGTYASFCSTLQRGRIGFTIAISTRMRPPSTQA